MNQHSTLDLEKWRQFSLPVQMSNIGSEVERSINWRKKANLEYSQQALFRALELIDLTLASSPRAAVLQELSRVREVLVDFLAGDNIYRSTDRDWQKYFYAFHWAARKNT